MPRARTADDSLMLRADPWLLYRCGCYVLGRCRMGWWATPAHENVCRREAATKLDSFLGPDLYCLLHCDNKCGFVSCYDDECDFVRRTDSVRRLHIARNRLMVCGGPIAFVQARREPE